MFFTSFSYIVFLFFVTFIYWVVSKQYRWLVLLLASCYFYYTFIPVHLILLLIIIAITFFGGISLGKNKKRSKKVFVSLLVLNVGLLCVFKYLPFLTSPLSPYLKPEYHKLLFFLLPIGLSFYTFTLISYISDVYKKKYIAEKHLGLFALYVIFFPKIIAGPIERASNFIPQLYKESSITTNFIATGLQLIVLGFFKKLVIADRLAVLVDTVYSAPQNYVGVSLVVAVLAFTFQIYCDFSGYTDIARGSAMLLGIDLVENFRFPYIATSLKSFWQRWHISLSVWFRDYIYIPLGGNRVSKTLHFRNILISFFLSGLWHGAGLLFIIWGALHGLYLILSEVIYSQPFIKQLSDLSKVKPITVFFGFASTFLFVSFSWIFFRAETFEDAFYIISHMQIGVGAFMGNLINGNMNNVNVLLFGQGTGLGLSPNDLLIGVLALAFLFIFEYFSSSKNIPIILRWVLYIVLVLGIVNLSYFTEQPFIYVQF